MTIHVRFRYNPHDSLVCLRLQVCADYAVSLLGAVKNWVDLLNAVPRSHQKRYQSSGVFVNVKKGGVLAPPFLVSCLSD
jgi:hypothetical protein